MKANKVIWITGASSGIGKALALEFAKNEETVIATSRNFSLLQYIKKELGDKSKFLIPFELDIRDSNAVSSFFSEVSKNHDISALINNAGLSSFKPAVEDSIDEIKNIIEVNLLGAIYCIKTILPSMIQNKKGIIINILSVVTQRLFKNSSAYSASKSGLMAYSQVLREEVRDKNIRILNIYPGATKTSIWPNNVLEKYSHKMMAPEEIAKIIFQIYSQKYSVVTEEIILRPIQGDL